MLVLSRKPGETVVIGGTVTLTVLGRTGGRIRIGIAAPNNVRILRGELLQREEAIGEGVPGRSIALAEVLDARTLRAAPGSTRPEDTP
jgi:carbon storage regulator